MSDDVKPEIAPGRAPARRSYDATRRRELARARRRAVLTAAQRLFEEHGYRATTIVDVARAAGVSAESIYKSFGSKAALLKEVFDVVIAGDDEPVAVPDRAEARAIQAEPDLLHKLLIYADQASVRAQRSAAIQIVIRNGAASDPDLRRLWDQLTEQRLAGMGMLARHLTTTGGLRADPDAVRDILWACISVEVYDLFVHQRGWSVRAYTDWLARTLVANIVDD